MKNFKTIWLLLISLNIVMRPNLAYFLHMKCRGGVYPRSNIQRFPVPDDKVTWSEHYEEYDPPKYESVSIRGKPWADPDIDGSFKGNWNNIDGNVNRTSYIGTYNIEKGYPLNPMGRTGIRGRGVLGRWGPNHAADPVVSRWKKLENGDKSIHNITNKPILQFISIKRGDNGDWALPGGMVDPGEKVGATAVREFQEEAINSIVMTEEEKQTWKLKFDKFFSEGNEVYRGYVDDPRNTDNAWMETVAYSFHDDPGLTVGALKLNAGDDAVGVRWVDANSDLKLYASHRDIVQNVVNRLGAHW